MTLLITRPEPQASRLAERLQAEGVKALVVPLLDIEILPPQPGLAEELAQAAWVIAVSSNAVAGLPKPLPKGPRYAAVGEATAQALRDAGAQAVLVAEPPDSEGLLAQPALAKVQDESILIARGNGGRELLAQVLGERGAQVKALELYRRQPVSVAPEQFLAWQDASVDQVLITSQSLLDALLATTPPPLLDWLHSLTLLVPSQRVADHCRRQGFEQLVLLKDASDEAIIHHFKESAAPMTDKTPTPPTQASEPKPSPKPAAPGKPQAAKGGKASLALALLALLLGAGALALSGWSYYQQQLAAKAPKAPTVDPARVAELERGASGMGATLAAQAKALKQQDAALAQLREQLAAVQQKEEQAVSWPREEAASLVRMANRRLYLAQDLTVAKALLEDADQALKQLPESSDNLAWRQAIAADLASLDAQPQIDRTAIAMRLGGLAQQVAKLPLNMVKLPDLAEQKADLSLTQDSGDWRDNLAKSWQRFTDDFIKIRKRDGEVAPLMSPSHQAYLREALRLALDGSRLALFAGDQERFQANLRQARDWLTGYADTKEQATQAFLGELDQLLALQISLSLPAQLDSLRYAEAKP
ncbi:uroporphyrinogen-III C-methyltransferase [Gallaecimonas kandeliae]|uniref:uroporphyrinogen-III C-methyltransferase n=1 Tax=Gallaecimonas kandeliae TaxID=3029055 RepID=UPI0026478F63|nr:uroporphyrinogen-III C-methyltransferase [Gallaecimonas kandeliae]WKE65565.1 uroporphyrinogen-III C-methyltransferase [Gallaecimonas kandeliae]